MMEILLSERHREEIREGVEQGRSGGSALGGRGRRISRLAMRTGSALMGIVGLSKLLTRRKATVAGGGEDIG